MTSIKPVTPVIRAMTKEERQASKDRDEKNNKGNDKNDWIQLIRERMDFKENKLTEQPENIVNEPKHYARWAFEPITFVMLNGFEFWRGNIIKYTSRAGYKLYEGMDQVQSEITDLEKVIRCSQMRINQLKGKTKL